MSAWLLATLLAAPPAAGWQPAEAPPPTPWAMAGARGWRQCNEAERRARAALGDDGARGGNATLEQRWVEHARRCPHAVDVLVIAAQSEILDTAALFGDLDMSDADEVPTLSIQRFVDEREARIEQALAWLDTAIDEAERRGERPPRETRYYRAYALTTLGRVPEARQALREVIEHGDVQRWRAERMSALVELFAGNVKEALRRAERGVVDAPPEDRLISRFIRALVLDRAGASSVAMTELRALSAVSGARLTRRAMESVLPIHEWLFFRALADQADGLRSSALRSWQAYLERPEPEQPERVLAQRHLDELMPSPTPTGP